MSGSSGICGPGGLFSGGVTVSVTVLVLTDVVGSVVVVVVSGGGAVSVMVGGGGVSVTV